MANDGLKIYFCGSIRGGRSDQDLYHHLITFLKKFGKVLTSHVGDKDLEEEHKFSSRDIYLRDMDWMKEADIVIAEVSTPSLGVGFEIANAINQSKKTLCLSRIKKTMISAMIAGCPELDLIVYTDIKEAQKAIESFIANKKNKL